MYSNISLSVQSGDAMRITEYFKSIIGVRQGDNLSPTLFNIFVNDLPKIFDSSCKPAVFGDMAINCMMYADDLIILSETNQGLQESMNRLHKYCEKWGIRVNTKKTKFMATIPEPGSNITLKYIDENIELVTSYKYLGIQFQCEGQSNCMKLDLFNRASKAYFKLLRTMSLMPKSNTMLHLFDHLIKPILLYGCEIWYPTNFEYRPSKENVSDRVKFNNTLRQPFPYITKYMEKIDPIEKLHLKFCKRILGVHTKSTNMAIYAELGRYPLFIEQICQSLKYLNYIENDTENSLLKKFYKNIKDSDRLSKLCNLYQMRNQLGNYVNVLPITNSTGEYKRLKNNLQSSFDIYWYNMVNTDISMSGKDGGNKLRTYRTFKKCIRFENYLNLNNFDKRRKISQLRISAHNLKIETGRFNSKNGYMPPELRLCDHCDLNKIENELHLVTECPLYEQIRNDLFSAITKTNMHFKDYSPTNKFIWLNVTEDLNVINDFGTFLCEAFRIRKNNITVN